MGRWVMPWVLRVGSIACMGQAPFHIAVFDADFVDEIVGESGDLVAGSIAVFELIDESLAVGFDRAITLF